MAALAGQATGAGSGLTLTSLTCEARCKVNLGLSVMARRGDGYHQIETIMARLTLADTLEIALREPETGREDIDLRVVAAAPSQGGGDEPVAVATSPEPNDMVARDVWALPTNSDNLVVKAAAAYLGSWARSTGRNPPAIDMTLVKRLPVAAGLGGGSADAAATLRGLERLLPAGVDTMALAKALGSDVPFFVAGHAAALARGRGERLAPLTLPPADLVLVKPAVAVTAKEAYEALLGFSPRLKVEPLLTALADGREPGWKNALQTGVAKRYPVVREVLALLKEAGLRGCLMSGSGPTCFGLAADAAEAERVADQLRVARPELWVQASSLG